MEDRHYLLMARTLTHKCIFPIFAFFSSLFHMYTTAGPIESIEEENEKKNNIFYCRHSKRLLVFFFFILVRVDWFVNGFRCYNNDDIISITYSIEFIVSMQFVFEFSSKQS